jgi:alpha-tubulin suppressor-like RCC1 family protein
MRIERVTWRRRAALLTTLVAAATLAAGPVPATAVPADPIDLSALLSVRTAALKASGVPVAGALAGNADDISDLGGGGHSFGVGDDHSCAATTFNDVWCWGGNADGQLGNGTTTDSVLPVRASAVGGLKDKITTNVSAGRAHTCALTLNPDVDSSDVYCWGDNSVGQLGDSSLTPRTRPVQVAAGAYAVTTGRDHTCVITADVTVSCWGRNDLGQLGIGTQSAAESTPQEVPGLADVIDISADDNNTCALDKNGDAWCWGSDTHGQLGDGGGSSGTPQASPVAVTMSGVTGGFTQIDVGLRHACALGDSSAVYCWGDDAAGQLGNGASASDPSRPRIVTAGGRRFISVSAGGDSSCAIDINLAGWCWGDNSAGQLGVGDTTDRETPAAIDQSGIRVSAIAATVLGNDDPLVIDLNIGLHHACAVDLESGVYCWGSNTTGRLGDGTTDDADIPVATALLPGPVTAVRAAPRDHGLRVSWTPPEDTGVAPVRGYAVLAFAGSGSGALLDAEVCQTTSGQACTVTGLKNGSRHTVLVAAVTLAGVSYSDAGYGVPRGASGAGGGLPITGPDVPLHLALAGVLLGTGLVLLRVARRRPGLTVRG